MLSSRIEGIQTTVADLYAFEAGQVDLAGPDQPRQQSDAREVLNYVQALQYGIERLRTLPISLRFLCEVHERLLAGVRGQELKPGEFRRRQNFIGNPGSPIIEARFAPPPVPDMHACLDAFEKYLHADDGEAPSVRRALSHYQFEVIHPFLDGNCRLSRLLLTLLLIDWELLPLPLLYLSAYFERHRDTYHDLLLTVSERGAWREWVLFFLTGVAEQSRDTVARAKQLQHLQAAWRECVTARRASTLLPRLVDKLFESPYLTIPMAQEFLGVSYPAAKQNVEKLVEADILHEVRRGPAGRLFVAQAIIDLTRA